MDTPNYIKALLIPNGRKPTGRKVWSIDLEMVWLPFFHATGAMGETHISPDALGAPLRLAYDTDGSVKFSKSGRPITKVAKELSDNIRLVRENFTAGLISYANTVVSEKPEAYKAQIEAARIAGEPILKKDRENLEQALAQAIEQAIAEAQAKAGQADMAEPAERQARQGEEVEAKHKSKGRVLVTA